MPRLLSVITDPISCRTAARPWRRSIAYDLLDTRRSNIEALVGNPDVADTDDVDREHFEIPFEAAYGDRWMWVAHGIPVLRDARVRWTVIVMLVILAVWGGAVRSRRPEA